MVLLPWSLILAVIAFVHSAALETATTRPFKSEKDLRRDLFRNYDKNVRPVKKQSSAVPVGISLSPIALRYVNVKDQLLSLESLFKMNWTDEYLQWDPSEYDDITLLQVPIKDLWKPDVSLYTAFTDTAYFPTDSTDTIVYNNGMVLWVPPFTINNRCPVPLGKYGSESRAFLDCNIRMGSWTHSGKLLDLQLGANKVDLSDFQDYNPEWKLVKINSNRDSRKYPCCPEEYPFVDFNITLKRR